MGPLAKLKAMILLFVLLLSKASAATAPASEIEFRNSTIQFQAVRTPKTLKFSDRQGARELKIQSCNKKIVDTYWKSLVRKVNSLQSTGPLKLRVPASAAWVKYEGIQMRVLDFEPSMKFFNRVPATTHMIFWESKRLCKGK
jgi:hypothetical protein